MSVLVNGERVEEETVRAEAEAMRPRYEQLVEAPDPLAARQQLLEWARENVIERILLKQEAARLRTDVDALVQRITGKAKRPRYKELGDFYQANQDRFWRPELVDAAHIVRHVEPDQPDDEALAALSEAQQRLEAGEPFDAVAESYSDCKGSGGRLGPIPRGEMVEDFENVVFQLPVGQPSPMFRTVFGWHIAYVYGRRPEGFAPFEEVKNTIEEQLWSEKKQAELDRFLDGLRAKADIR